MKKISWGIIIGLAIFGIGIFSAQAQEKTKAETCQEYYSMGSLSGNVLASENNPNPVLAPGGTAEYHLIVNNTSKVFIPDANIILRIEKMQTSRDDKGVVDTKIIKEEILPDQIALNPGEIKKIDYTFQVPEQIENGIYTIKIFPVRGKNINIETYGFDIFERSAEANKTVQFEITGQNEGQLSLAPNGLKINGAVYDGKGIGEAKTIDPKSFKTFQEYFKAKKAAEAKDNNAVINENEQAKISQSFQNIFSEKKDLVVSQKLYKGNYYSEENKIDSISQNLSVEAGKGVEVVYDATGKIKKDFPLPYYLRTKITYQGGEAITITPLFNRKNYNGSSPFLSYYPFLDNFPMKKGDAGNMIDCVNRMGTFTGIKIDSVLRDEAGNEIARIEKSDEQGGNANISFEKTAFKLNKDYATLTLATQIYQNSELIDHYEVTYDNSNKATGQAPLEKTKNNALKNSLLIFVAIVILGIVAFLIYRKKNRSVSGLFFIFFLVSGIILADSSWAATTTDFSISQTGAAITFEGANPNNYNGGGGLDCGGPLFMAVQSFNTKYWITGTSSKSFSQSGSTLTYSSGTIVNGDTLGFGFRGTYLNGNEDTGYSQTYSPIFHPISGVSVAGAISNSSIGISAVGSIGYTNTIGLAGGIAGRVGANPFFVAGIGLMGVLKYPHYFIAPSSGLTGGITDCSTFNLNDCESNACVNIGGSPNLGAALVGNKCLNLNSTADNRTSMGCTLLGGYPTEADRIDCMAGACEWYGGGWNSSGNNDNDRCKTEAEQWIDQYNNCVAVRNSCNGNSGFLNGLQSWINNLTARGATTVQVASDPSDIINCSGSGCTFTGNAGTAQITTTLPPRGLLSGFLVLGGVQFAGVSGVCTVNNLPLTLGFGGFGQASYSFNVTVTPPPTNGACKTSVGTTGEPYPSFYPSASPAFPSGTANSTFCASTGAASTTVATYPTTWNWQCTGQNGGTTANCRANRRFDGACGTADRFYAESETAYVGTFCSTSPAPTPTNPPPFPIAGASTTWNCPGVNGGNSTACTAEHGKNGICGGAHNHTFEVADNAYTATFNQCALAGSTPSSYSFPALGSSTTWTCSGLNGGASSGNCTAYRRQNASCGTADYRTHIFTVSENSYGSRTLCLPLAPVASVPSILTSNFPPPGGSISYTCSGIYGGNSASCIAKRNCNGDDSCKYSTCEGQDCYSSCDLGHTNPIHGVADCKGWDNVK